MTADVHTALVASESTGRLFWLAELPTPLLHV